MKTLIKSFSIALILIILAVATITIYTKDAKRKETREALTEAMEEVVESLGSDDEDNKPANEEEMIAYLSKGIADRVTSVSAVSIVIYGIDYSKGMIDAEVTANFNYLIGQGEVVVRKCIYLDEAAVVDAGSTSLKEEEETEEIVNSLSFEKTVESSGSIDEDNTETNAVDGKSDTKWVSKIEDAAWISVDLGMVYSISSLSIVWGDEYATSYEILVSSDNITWKSVHLVENKKNGKKDKITIDDTVCRYIKFQGITRSNEEGFYEISEFEVFATEYEE